MIKVECLVEADMEVEELKNKSKNHKLVEKL